LAIAHPMLAQIRHNFFFWAAQDVSSYHLTHLGWATGQPGKKTDSTFVLSAIRTHC